MSDIVIDITRIFAARGLGRIPTGVDRVSLEYLRHYGTGARAMLSAGRFLAVLPKDLSGSVFQSLLESGVPSTTLALRLIGAVLVRCAVTPTLAGTLLLHTAHMGLDHCPGLRLWRRRGAKPVIFVHDLIPISHPEYCRPGEKDRHILRMRNALIGASGIITNSHCTLRSLEEFAKSSELKCPPAVVAPLGNVPFGPPGPRPVDAPYFVILGTIEPRKNHWLLLQVWRRIVERLGSSAPRLVVIGRRGWECENVVDLLERSTPLAGFVIERNDCSDGELAQFLGHACALLMPSFAEGYGLPVVEALGLGTPVIASDLQVFREIAGTMPDYVDPLDAPRWTELIMEYARRDGAARATQITRIGGYQAPTWRAHFELVDSFLKGLAA